jgi:hypothetical protein
MSSHLKHRASLILMAALLTGCAGSALRHPSAAKGSKVGSSPVQEFRGYLGFNGELALYDNNRDEAAGNMKNCVSVHAMSSTSAQFFLKGKRVVIVGRRTSPPIIADPVNAMFSPVKNFCGQREIIDADSIYADSTNSGDTTPN